MLPSKLKRKLTDDKGKSNGKGKQEKEVVVETESDYESDEVSFVVAEPCASVIYRRGFRRTSSARSRTLTVPTTRMWRT